MLGSIRVLEILSPRHQRSLKDDGKRKTHFKDDPDVTSHTLYFRDIFFGWTRMIRLLIHYHQSYLRICIVENYTAFKKRWYHETDTLLFVSNRERQNVVKNKRSRLDVQQNPYNTSSRRFRVSRWTYIELLCWNFYDKWDCGRYIRHSDLSVFQYNFDTPLRCSCSKTSFKYHL